MKLKAIILAGLLCSATAVILLLRVDMNSYPPNQAGSAARPIDLSAYAATAPARSIDLLFIHHSCGGQLLALTGDDVGTNCIYTSHPNGGALRERLQKNSYQVHEASYGSRIAEKTDLFDWLPKFRNQMDEILTCNTQDERYADGRRNEIVVFKSCFPNNDFRSAGTPPGNPMGPELTLANAKAAYTALLEEFRKQPKVLFVCVTTPPLAKPVPRPLWKQVADKIRGRKSTHVESARMAREFSNWLVDQNGWLKDSGLTNVVVFDYFDIMTGNGQSNFLAYPSGDGYDSHPTRIGNEKVAEAFIPFLNRAVRRAGLSS